MGAIIHGEWRNKNFSLRNPTRRGRDHPRKRTCLTAWHNFLRQRSDGTTAAKQCVGQKPRWMCVALLESVALPLLTSVRRVKPWARPKRIGWAKPSSRHLALHNRDRYNSIALFNGIDDLLSITRHFAKDGVLAIEPGGFDMGDEELRAVGVRPGIRHTQNARDIMLQLQSGGFVIPLKQHLQNLRQNSHGGAQPCSRGYDPRSQVFSPQTLR